jgi:hypothetical protein
LKSNGLITKDELAQHKNNLRDLVQLYAISAMHNCVVQVGDGTTTKLKAHPDLNHKKISVVAAVPDAIAFKPNVTVASSMFRIDADPANHCHPDLLKNSNWDFEIELDENRQLARLG